MKEYSERRGKYDVTVYAVPIDKAMKNDALTFAKRIVLSDNQYSRLLPAEVRASGDAMQQKIEIQRTYMGKLGELAFLRFLQEKGKSVSTKGMLDVFPGQKNVDPFDFITSDGCSVDVKTGFRAIHKRLLVNTEQFDHIPKDYYVAVKLDAIDTDAEQKLVNWDTVSTAAIMGYAEHSYMQKHAEIFDFGEGPARWLPYKRLMGIDRLLIKF